MTDFLKRISQVALGLTSAIQPLVLSRYAPSTQLPVYEIPGAEDHPSANSIPHQLDPAVGSDSLSAHASSNIDPLPRSQASASPDSGPLNVEADRGLEKHVVIAPLESSRARVTLSSEDAERSPSVSSLQDSAGRLREEGPTTRTVSASEKIDVRGVTHHARESASPATSQPGEDVFAVDEASFETNQTPGGPGSDLMTTGFRPGSDIRNRGAAHHRSAAADSASTRSENEFLEFAGDIEHERQGDFRHPVTPLRSGPSLLDQPRSRHAEPRSPSVPEERINTSSENVIRVTIGRIEVRAITAPLPPVESSGPPPPKVSLDEYLRQHKGRSR